ncbi:hypothetical protein IFM89_003679 [Coptis chinensis]|uniref:Uncharacterized protein n=1 Tax=Coptis chinensis TaxID=261450 RepID=A0A835MBM2_9MAGN|nr:hypothetical protein IFM89_003679 [Coptis chinensis]
MRGPPYAASGMPGPVPRGGGDGYGVGGPNYPQGGPSERFGWRSRNLLGITTDTRSSHRVVILVKDL